MPHQRTPFLLFLIMSCGLLAGCNQSVKTKTPPPRISDTTGDADICHQLKDVFENSVNGFRSIRTEPSYHNKATLWKANYQLIPDSCEIWQWSDKYSYICTRSMPDKNSAESVFQQATQQINQCLNAMPSDWQQQNVALDNQGEEVRYLLHNRMRGSLKVVDTGGIFQDSWTVYFRVDSPDLFSDN